jgi:gp16 family phage-associated protein
MRADSVALKPIDTRKPAKLGFDPDRLPAARKKLDMMGLSYKAWAEANGYAEHYGLVRNILAGQKRCFTGLSHEIAVKLGLKDGVLSDG